LPYSRVVACVLLLIAFSATSSAAKHASEPNKPKHVAVSSIPARLEDVSTIDGIIKAYYEVGCGPAGQARQWARDRTLYIQGVRLAVTIDDASGKPVVLQLTHQEFVDLADPDMVKNGFYEHEIHRITRRYGNWASLVSTSEARQTPDGPVTHRALDNVELFWDGKRWWIVYASITEERPDHPLPKEYLP
jgi:hypothetical protein